MQSLARPGYTAAEIIAALHAAGAHWAFRYELLDGEGSYIGDLDGVQSASINLNSLAEIHRTARFTLRDTGEVNFLADRVRPYIRLRMADGGWAEWPQGVFLLSTPPRRVGATGAVTREVEAYDLLQVLADDKLEDRLTVAAGTNYIAAVGAQLDAAGLAARNLTATDLVLPAGRDWPGGTGRLRVINDLLGAINYRPLWMDELGQAIAQPYVSPADRAPEYAYRDDAQSVLLPEVEQGLDLFAVPNKWVLVVSEPDRDPMVSTYTNTNAASPTSTVSRGRTIVDYRDRQEAADQATLDALAARVAFEASQVYEQGRFDTGIMPMHSHGDVLTLSYSRLGLNHKYLETSWGLELRAGARMQHQARRVVSV